MSDNSEQPSVTICEVDIDALIREMTSGRDARKLSTSLLVSPGVWAELRAIRMVLENRP